MVLRLAALVLLAALAGTSCSTRPATATAGRPALLVLITIDQFRYGYVTRFADLWTGGLRRLLDEGALFEEARYPYLNTVTCVGHATLGTGLYPVHHGIILNEWWEPALGRRTACTDDPDVEPVPYEGSPESTGQSAHYLQVPTFADRLRAHSPSSRVVSLAVKARSAIMMAGHGGLVTWFGGSDTWATSSAYLAAPDPVVGAAVAARSVDADRGATWLRLRAPGFYTGTDESAFERPPRGWAPVFPHPLPGGSGPDARRFYSLWERSPFADAYTGRLAARLAGRLELGRHAATDMLAVSLSAVDYVGHDFGPDSHEAEDAVMRVDAVLGELFAALDKTVGRGRYVVALSADHGAAPIPELRRSQGLDAGRVVASDIRAAVERALAGRGDAPHVADVQYTDIYLTAAARSDLGAHPDVMSTVTGALAGLPGIMRVLTSAELRGQTGASDPVLRAAALSHWPGRSGDIIIVPKPYWITTTSSATTHGTLHTYDQHAPVFLMGPGIRPGRYREPASPADIAPTFGALAGVPMPGVDGHVLTAALVGSE